MKKTFTILILLGLVSGCSEDFLRVVPQGTLFSSNYFETEEQVEEALFAVYDVLGHQKGYNLAWAPFLVMSEVLSDDAYAGGQDSGDGAEEDEFNTFTISTGNEIVQSIWKRNYYGIYRANFTMEKAGELVNTTEDFKNLVIAEAKFLRAFFYFEQVRFFENIVLTTTTQSPSEANVPQVDPALIYDQIASDLVDAIEGLPESHGSEVGRATKWAAKALLGRMFLFEKGIYGKGLNANDDTSVNDMYVLAQLEDVINNSGHALVDDYDSIFQSSGEFSPENVFEVVYDGMPVNGDWGSEQYIEGNLAAQMMGPRVAGSGIYYRGWSFAPPSHKLFMDMEGDPRRPLTILTEADILAESGTTLNKGAYQHTGYYSAKYTTRLADRGIKGTPELHNMTNYRVIRFADVLLMAAEIGKNVAYINKVRARVGLPALGGYSEEALFEERRMELSLEGVRYFDVLRRGAAIASRELTVTGVGPQYTDSEAVYNVTFNTATRGFLPIPQTEIDLSNGVLKQNAGY